MEHTIRLAVVLAATAAAWAVAASCQGPDLYERTPEPRHAVQESLLACPHCGGAGLVECDTCASQGGFVCVTCEGFGICRCPDCDLIQHVSDPSPEKDLFYQVKTLGGGDTGMEEFQAELFADKHLHGIDRRFVHRFSVLLLHGKRCRTCNSRGYVGCPDCDRGIHHCPKCKGAKYVACPLCRRTGFVPSLTGERVRQRGRIIRRRDRR